MTSRGFLGSSTRLFLRLAFLVAGLAHAVPSMASGTTSGPPPQVSVQGLVLSERVHVLSEATIQQLAYISPSGEIVFSTSTAELGALVPGDVIISPPSQDTPFGFARRVVAISSSAGPLVVHTEEPAIGDVIADGTIEVQGFIDSADIDQSTLPKGMMVQTDALTGDLVFHSFSVVLVDVDGDHGTTYDQVRASGQIRVSSEFYITLRVRGTEIKEFSATLEIRERSSLNLEGGLAGSYDKRLMLASLRLPPITIAWWLWLVPHLTFSVGSSGDVHADFLTGVTHRTDVSGSIGYIDGEFGAWGSESHEVNYTPLDVNGNLNVKADVQARLDFKVWDTVQGPYAVVEAYLWLYADIEAAHLWQLYAGLRSWAGIPIQGVPEAVLFEREWLILQENEAPWVDAGGPYHVDEGGFITLVATGFDPEDDALIYRWDLDDDWIFEASGQQVTFTAGIHDGPTSQLVRVEVTDDAGLYSSLSAVDAVSVAIFNAPPAVGAISVSPARAPAGATVTATASFTDAGVFDTHTGVWDWGDGTTSPGTVDESDGAGSVAGDHVYSTPGVYKLNLRLSDDDGGIGESAYEDLVVIEPGGRRVSGKGQVRSGRLWQGIILEVRDDAQTELPVGWVRFVAQRLDPPARRLALTLDRTSLIALRIKGNRAFLRGAGRLNGKLCRFQLRVLDASPGGSGDRFALVIFTKAGGPSYKFGGVLTAGNLTVVDTAPR